MWNNPTKMPEDIKTRRGTFIVARSASGDLRIAQDC